MLERLRAHLFGQSSSPTADLYLLNAMGEAGLHRALPTVIETERALVVVRHHLGTEIAPAGRKLIYVIDDDVLAGPGDPSLPLLYRLKLSQVDRPAARALLPVADEVVVSTPYLAKRYGPLIRNPATVLTPHWSEPVAARAAAPKAPIRLAYLGSDTHARDLAFIAPVLLQILEAVPEAELWLPGNLSPPQRLARHPRCHRLTALDWPDWRRALANLMIDLALYPLLDTPFNRARSVNKLIEHGIAGAAGLYSETWPEAHHIGPGEGLVLPNDRGRWAGAAIELLRDRDRLQDLAIGARTLAVRLNDPARQRAFWQTHLFG